MNCKKCGKPLPEGALQCPECYENCFKLCFCGEKVPENAETCCHCGRSFDESSGEQTPRLTFLKDKQKNEPADFNKWAPFSKPLIMVIISNALFLIAYLCIHKSMAAANLFFNSSDIDEIISGIQWLRFSTVLFTFANLSIILWDTKATKKAKTFTVLSVVFFFVISWFFLFPAIPAEDLLQFLY